ncbi:hypothetical protein OIDMADRAFT_51125 [Oidiodendron maius Zn]|uniref:Peptidase S53 domain-containing protein n=1 Tax=Oidiodendron maius (strain Zn) TaxID=913774 RepID=A0A0C3HQL8_OIDMZ|nr:hypothetical protein OIDMADRAFT_51125 [Oidiodendron maius Zn]
MKASTFVLLGAALASSVAAIPSSSHVVHEKRETALSGWVNLGRVDPTTNLVVRIGLSQSNLDQGHSYLMDVSHPGSANYGKFWTEDEITETFAPAAETVDNVRQWLSDAGIDDSSIIHTENKGWLVFAAKAQDVEDLLQTTYYKYSNTKTGQVVTACEQYHVPRNLQDHIDYINPGVGLPTASSATSKAKRQYGHSLRWKTSHVRRSMSMQLPRRQAVTSNLSACDTSITPNCLRALYKFPQSNSAQPNNSLGIFTAPGNHYAQEDLNKFFANYSSNIPQGTHPIPDLINGAKGTTTVDQASTEADLDFEVAYPIVYPQTLTLYQLGGSFNSFLDAIDGSYCKFCAYGECGDDSSIDPSFGGNVMCGTFKPTNVISISYGLQEQDLPANYQKRMCMEFMKLGLQGVSVLVASGDNGVAGPAGDGSANGCLGTDLKVFSPAFPNTCPYVTNVGATKVDTGKTVLDPEVAAYDPPYGNSSVVFSSGGGFSNIYDIADYQQEAVETYFLEHNPPYAYYSGNDSFGANGGVYNRLGRAYPDVSANGQNIIAVVNGRRSHIDGTSASAPIFASIINRIIDERIAHSKGPVGFINPALYLNPGILNDITEGSNPGCGTNGFSAAPGWDPVTGLGTPNYPSMKEYFLSLP